MAVMDTGAGMTGGIAAVVAAVAAAPGARRQTGRPCRATG